MTKHKIDDVFGYRVIKPTNYAEFVYKPLTRWQKIACWWEEIWNEVVLPSLLVTAAIGCFCIAIFFMFGH